MAQAFLIFITICIVRVTSFPLITLPANSHVPSKIAIRIQFSSQNITLTLQGPSQGWFGVGFGKDMIHADALIYSSSGNGNATIRNKRLRGQGISYITDQSVQLWHIVNETVGASSRVFALTRAMSGPPVTSDMRSFNASERLMNLIWARSSTTTYQLGYHGDFRNAVQINLETGQASTISESPLIKLHAVLMVTAWIFFAPCMFIASRCRHYECCRVKSARGKATWFVVHAYILATSIAIFVLIGFGAILTHKDDKIGFKTPGETPHAMFGFLVLIWLFFQIIAGACRPHKDTNRPSCVRTVWFWAHRVSGILLWLLACTTIFFGMKEPEANLGPGARDVFLAVVIAMVFIIGVVSVTVPKMVKPPAENQSFVGLLPRDIEAVGDV